MSRHRQDAGGAARLGLRGGGALFADATRAGKKLEEPENPARHRSRSPIWKRDAPLDATTLERPHVPSVRRLMLSRLVQPTRLFRHALSCSPAPRLHSRVSTARQHATHRAAARAFMSSANKRMAPTKIGTHDGSFHCDEALGCFLLKRTAAFENAEVVRSRDPEVLAACDIVIDVGAVYEPENNRFDHHQRGFEEIFGHGFTTKLSSAGLVYKHFGREIVARVLDFSKDDPRVETIHLKTYKTFVEAVDAIDNGVNMYDTDAPPKYENNTGLSSRVGKLNPAWNEPSDAATQATQFAKAMELTGSGSLPPSSTTGTAGFPRAPTWRRRSTALRTCIPAARSSSCPATAPGKSICSSWRRRRARTPFPSTRSSDSLRRVEDSGDSPHPQLVREP